MAQPLVALGIDNTMPDALGAYQHGVQANQTEQHNQIANATQTAELLGAGSLYALGGDINGEVDPQKYNEVLDSFQNMGLDVGKYRGNPNYAKVFANASVSFLDRAKLARDDRDFAFAMKKFDEDVREFDATNATNKAKIEQADNSQYGTVYYAHRKGPNGEDIIVPVQARKGGGLIESAMPEGVDSMVLPNEAASMREQGKAAGQASATLAGSDAMLADIDKKIGDVANDPDLGVMLGSVDSRMPNMTERSGRVQSKIDQLSGDAFLQARVLLKGGGAITDFESAKAESAYSRLTAQNVSEADYKAALADFKDAVHRGVDKLKAQAKLGSSNAPAGGGGGTEENWVRGPDGKLQRAQ